MKFRTKIPSLRTASAIIKQPRFKGFTLVEVLVALTLMAIVIPVTVQGLRLASLAGEVSQRRAIAAQIAERVLNEAIVTGQGSAQSGVEKAGPYEFRWSIHNEPWNPPPTQASVTTANGINPNAVNASTMQQISAEVKFSAQGKDHSVKLSTLVNVSQQTSGSPPPQMDTLP